MLRGAPRCHSRIKTSPRGLQADWPGCYAITGKAAATDSVAPSSYISTCHSHRSIEREITVASFQGAGYQDRHRLSHPYFPRVAYGMSPKNLIGTSA